MVEGEVLSTDIVFQVVGAEQETRTIVDAIWSGDNCSIGEAKRKCLFVVLSGLISE